MITSIHNFSVAAILEYMDIWEFVFFERNGRSSAFQLSWEKEVYVQAKKRLVGFRPLKQKKHTEEHPQNAKRELSFFAQCLP
jgi:hypothetical protein